MITYPGSEASLCFLSCNIGDAKSKHVGGNNKHVHFDDDEKGFFFLWKEKSGL